MSVVSALKINTVLHWCKNTVKIKAWFICKHYCHGLCFLLQESGFHTLKAYLFEGEQWVQFQNRTNTAVICFHTRAVKWLVWEKTAGPVDLCQMNCKGQTKTIINCVRCKKMPWQLLLNYNVFGEFVGTMEEMQLSLTGRLMKHQNNTKNLCPSAIFRCEMSLMFFFTICFSE